MSKCIFASADVGIDIDAIDNTPLKSSPALIRSPRCDQDISLLDVRQFLVNCEVA